MLAVTLSLLFGLAAVAALAQIYVAVNAGLRRGRQIMAELSAVDRVRAQPLRPARAASRLAPA